MRFKKGIIGKLMRLSLIYSALEKQPELSSQNVSLDQSTLCLSNLTAMNAVLDAVLMQNCPKICSQSHTSLSTYIHHTKLV